jgi:hypothetical protein
MTANEIMRYVRQWHEQIGDMPSKQGGPKLRQIYREMERVIAKHIDSYAISHNRQQEPDSQKRPAQLTVVHPHATRAGGNVGPPFLPP